MADITFSKEELAAITGRIQLYFREELAQLLLEFFAEEIGGYFYNRGLYDAQALLNDKLEDISDALYQLEKPTGGSY